MYRISLTLIFVFCCVLSFAQQVQISGYIVDANSKEALIGATLYHAETGSGAATNEYGFYSFSIPKQDSVLLRVSYVGYTTMYLRLPAKANIRQDISLSEEGLLEEVVVTAQEESTVEEVQMSKISVPVSTIKAMPALLGEVDILKTLQLLPGIQSGAEGTSGIYVRGGGPDQNLILLDGVPVYNASHLFGFFSVFNSDAVKHVDVYKGGFPARYGGRLSSVLDIRMKEGNMREWHGEGGIGIISSRFTLEGPLKKDVASMMISGRRTYIDILARPIIKSQTDDGETAGYYFYDLNTKFNIKLNDKNRLYASAYLGDDKFYSLFEDDYSYDDFRNKSKDEAGIRWGNVTSSLRWNHIFSEKMFANSTLTYSKYQFKLFTYSEDETWNSEGYESQDIKAEYISNIRDFAYRFDLDYAANNQHQLRTGALIMHHRFRPGVFQFVNNEYEENPDNPGTEDNPSFTFGQPPFNSIETQLYLEDDYLVNNKIKLNLGLHASSFHTEGKSYYSLQPRFNSRLLLNKGLSLKASFVTMRQYIHLLTNSGIGLPTDLWVPSTDKVAPQRAWQAAAGAVKDLGKGYQLSLEAYYKKMSQLIEYKEAASYFNLEEDWQSQVTSGQGEGYGTELFLEKKTGEVTGWLGYTLSWSNRQFDDLNLGQPYSYKYDRRHDISVVLNYQPSERSILSTTWVYGTGNAITLPLATYQYQDDIENSNSGVSYGDDLKYYSSRNDYRMRAYHRMDLSYSRIKKVRWGERRWVFSVYNLYNRKNPFYIDVGYDDETNSRSFIQYSLFTIIPSVAYNFKF